MSDTIEKLRLLKKLDQNFPATSNSGENFQDISDDEYIKLLKGVLRYVRLDRGKNRLCINRFLYSGCVKFDRFAVPTPFVVGRQQHLHFKSFLDALIKAEHGDPTNTALFMLRDIRCQIYRDYDTKPSGSAGTSAIKDYCENVEKVVQPGNPNGISNFQEEKEKCIDILNGLNDGSLKTTIKTRIPFIIHRSPLTVCFNWSGIDVRMSSDPSFIQGEQSFASFGPASQQQGPSRWNTGYTELRLDFDALIDCDSFAEPLQAIHGEKSLFDGWPKCFSVAFHILREVVWNLRLEHGGENQWIPAPTDIGYIEWWISSSRRDQIDWCCKDSPASMMNLFVPSSERLDIDLGSLLEPIWSEQCRSFAIMYFEMGQKEEALFWLNVGVEALFEERFVMIAETSGISSLEKDLASPKAFWAQAEEVVAKQFPEIAQKIIWPDNEIHVSIYAKLKYLYRTVSMKTKHKELLKHYSRIQRYRNDLFHGRRSTIITVDIVNKAIDSFDWINGNFELAAGDC